jgi:inosine-uridine nucleoside N-ribohydrolase
MLLKSPQFDVKLITTTNGRQDYRAKLIAKLLTIAGRTDIPIGLGAGELRGTGKQQPWVENDRLEAYGGRIERDGIGALITTVRRSPQPITLIAIGPLQTVAAAVQRDPTIAGKVNFVGMQGSVYRGYNGAPNPEPEWNVKSDIPAAKTAFAAPWRSAAITPLDTCGVAGMKLAGQRIESLQHSRDPLTMAVLENYAIWAGHAGHPEELKETSTLFDTVAIYLADPANHPLLHMESLKLTVSDDGVTVISPTGAHFDVATRWNDLEGYLDYLVATLSQPGVHRFAL